MTHIAEVIELVMDNDSTALFRCRPFSPEAKSWKKANQLHICPFFCMVVDID